MHQPHFTIRCMGGVAPTPLHSSLSKTQYMNGLGCTHRVLYSTLQNVYCKWISWDAPPHLIFHDSQCLASGWSGMHTRRPVILLYTTFFVREWTGMHPPPQSSALQKVYFTLRHTKYSVCEWMGLHPHRFTLPHEEIQCA